MNELNAMFNRKSNTACNNALFSCGSLSAMHETMKRLYEAARLLRGAKSPTEVAKLLDESQQTVKNWEYRGISKAGLLKAQDFIGCRAEWVRDGKGAMTEGGELVTPLSRDEVSIPQYNTGGMGGNGGLVLRDQPGTIANWSVSHDWLRANVPNCTNAGNLCIVTGFGDSMPDTYNPGDPVLIDTGIAICDHDGVFFFRVGNEGFIKRLQRVPGVGIRAISQNKEYETWTITPDMDFEVFGKVLKAWKGKNY